MHNLITVISNLSKPSSSLIPNPQLIIKFLFNAASTVVRGAWRLVMTKQKKQLTKQSIRADDVFKVKNKSVKKQNRGKAIKTKSVSNARDAKEPL